MPSVRQPTEGLDTLMYLSGVTKSVRLNATNGCARSAVYTLLALGLILVLLARQVSAVQTTLTWDDSLNGPASVVGYRLYYWQAVGQTPVSLDVGKQTTYTLTGLQAGQTYSFAVTAYNSAGESAYSNVVSQTFPTDAPVAGFRAMPSIGPAPLNVIFISASTGTITSWTWTFGDGATSTAPTPFHTYTAVGTYTVQLTATGPSGTDTATVTVTVTVSNPPAAFSATPPTGPAPPPPTLTPPSPRPLT